MKNKIRKLVAAIVATVIVTSSIVSGLSASASTSTQRFDTYRVYFHLKPNSGVTQVTVSASFTFSRNNNDTQTNSPFWEIGNIGDYTSIYDTGWGNQYAYGFYTRLDIEFNAPTVSSGLLASYTVYTIYDNVSSSYTSDNPYVETSVVKMGDVNGDGVVDVLDLIALMNFVSFGTPLVNYLAADINNDGYITSQDIAILMNYVYGHIDRLA